MLLDAQSTTNHSRNMFGDPAARDVFAGGVEDSGRHEAAMAKIAAKIGSTRRPGASSAIPAGATYLAQFAVHDLDFPGREDQDGSHIGLLELGLIYGDGPRHDAFCYQVPESAGEPRYLLRIGRTRPTRTSPAWGAARDLPRVACPHLDQQNVEARTEVLVPNAFSDSNALLAQMQTLWVLLHNAVASTIASHGEAANAFSLACTITRSIYHDALRADVLGTWLLPSIRDRYTDPRAKGLGAASRGKAPLEFMAGVARLGHGLVREIYSLNDVTPVMGLRNIVRHTSTGRPHEMPLTEDWLVDFSRFFAIGTSVPQKARALGTHVARPFAGSGGGGASFSADGLVLRDLLACTRKGLRSVRSMVERVNAGDAQLLEGCFAQDESRWQTALATWLADTGLERHEIERLAQDPPLTLFLMLEAEADADGQTLGALGSIIMGETFAAGMAFQIPQTDAVAEARRLVFNGEVPTRMAEVIQFLQDRYQFADGARLCPARSKAKRPATRPTSTEGSSTMFDHHKRDKTPIPRIEIADYIEMGRLVVQWATGEKKPPADIEELKKDLDGIAVVPDRIQHVQFVQGTLDTLIIRLPVKEMVQESEDVMSDPMANGQYPLPMFYADYYRPGFSPVMTPLDLLYARVGDYTIAQCR